MNSWHLTKALNGSRVRRRSGGYTMVELATVISIAAVLVSIGVPSYQYITRVNRIAAEVNGLLGDLQYARMEAVKEGQFVSVCPSADQQSCTGGTSWSVGWIVFQDPNSNQAVDAGETVLRARQAFTGQDSATSDQGAGAITFNREGFAGLPAPGTRVAVMDNTNNAVYTRCLNVTPIGSLSTQKTGVGRCP